MLNKRAISELQKTFDTETLEKSVIYSFLKRMNLSHSKSRILKDYFHNFSNKPELDSEITRLNIRSLKELENYLEILIPEQDRKFNGAFFTPTYIVDFIIRRIKPQEQDRNLDPSCGCGAFLIGLVEYYQKKFITKIRQIINENIFGADILNYNIRRTKILLSIFALQNQEILDEEDFNLSVQDSLRADWRNCFERNKAGTFDNIVGNPPYVKFQDLSNTNRRFLANNWATIQNGTFNLYFAFFELGFKLLDQHGKLGYITPNNYFTSLAGEPLRRYFQYHQCVSHIVDFSHKKVFDAQTYTAITFLNKKTNSAIYYDRNNEDQPPEMFLKKVDWSPNDIKELNFKKWRLLKSEEQENIKIIESNGTPLNELVDVCVGIATLKDELYFIDSKTEKNGYYLKSINEKVFEIEKHITKSIYKISDFKGQEKCNHNTRRIIFPYKIINGEAIPITAFDLKKESPKCYDYFNHVKDKLKDRDKGKINYEPFYVYGRTQGLTKTGKKIVTPTFSQFPRFMVVLEEDALFCNGYGLFFKEKKPLPSLFNNKPNLLSQVENTNLLQKVLNSYVMHYYVSRTSVSIEGNYLCYQKNFIEKFTIPNFTENELETLMRLNEKKEIDHFLINKYRLNLNPKSV